MTNGTDTGTMPAPLTPLCLSVAVFAPFARFA